MTALITGVTSQDRAYLAELLLVKGHVVHDIKGRASRFYTARIDHLYQDPHEGPTGFLLHHGDLKHTTAMQQLVAKMIAAVRQALAWVKP